ncbi:uncharacterized protein CEXT_486441 [Caerostris extrusa]|nr:uncharacterized protein CEXT_486441 [Caerostris extrusa]
MPVDTSPIAAGFAILLVFIFIILLITWCCKQFNHTKEATVTLLPQNISPQHRYISTIDVQTGLPVIVDITTLNSAQNRARILAARRASSPCPINMRCNTSLYGSIAQEPPPPPIGDFLSRTPPPPYTEIPAQHAQHRELRQ